jgi:hypothetical protein
LLTLEVLCSDLTTGATLTTLKRVRNRLYVRLNARVSLLKRCEERTVETKATEVREEHVHRERAIRREHEVRPE